MAHIKWEQNIVTDCMSRPALALQIDACNLPEIVLAQATDNKIKLYSNIKEYPVLNRGVAVLYDTSTMYSRLFIPEHPRKAVFDSLHSLAHPGIRTSKK